MKENHNFAAKTGKGNICEHGQAKYIKLHIFTLKLTGFKNRAPVKQLIRSLILMKKLARKMKSLTGSWSFLSSLLMKQRGR